MKCDYCQKEVGMNKLRFFGDGMVPGTSIKRSRAKCADCIQQSSVSTAPSSIVGAAPNFGHRLSRSDFMSGKVAASHDKAPVPLTDPVPEEIRQFSKDVSEVFGIDEPKLEQVPAGVELENDQWQFNVADRVLGDDEILI